MTVFNLRRAAYIAPLILIVALLSATEGVTRADPPPAGSTPGSAVAYSAPADALVQSSIGVDTQPCWSGAPPLDPGWSAHSDPSSTQHGAMASRVYLPYGDLEDIVAGEIEGLPTVIAAETELIIVARATGSEAKLVSNGPLELATTRSTLQIEQTLKGAVPPGESVVVIEAGGTYRPRVYNPIEPTTENPFGKPPVDGGVEGTDYTRGEEVESRILGVPVIKAGERVLVFLKAYEGPLSGDAYVVQGVFQGKMTVTDDGVLDFPGPDSLLTGASAPQDEWVADPVEYQLNARLQGCPLDEVTAGIRAILANEN